MTAQGTRDWLRPLGSTGLTVSAIGVGGGPLGSVPAMFGHDTPEKDAVELVRATLESPVRMLDTSNSYSAGASERRIGLGIAQHGGLPPDFVLSTKVDAKDGSFSAQRVHTSLTESRARLGLTDLPLVYLHDPEYFDWSEIAGPGGAIEGLLELRANGELGHLGVAVGNLDFAQRCLDLGVFDVILTHSRYTLVDTRADALIDNAVREGVAVVNAAVHGGGLLSRPDAERPMYGYREAHPALVDAARRMATVCVEAGTDLATAALQFSLRDPRVDSTIVGMSSARRLEQTLAAAREPLPSSLFEELAALRPPSDALWAAGDTP